MSRAPCPTAAREANPRHPRQPSRTPTVPWTQYYHAGTNSRSVPHHAAQHSIPPSSLLLPPNCNSGTTGPIVPCYCQLINCHSSHYPREMSAPSDRSLLSLGFGSSKGIPIPQGSVENPPCTSRNGCARSHGTGAAVPAGDARAWHIGRAISRPEPGEGRNAEASAPGHPPAVSHQHISVIYTVNLLHLKCTVND